MKRTISLLLASVVLLLTAADAYSQRGLFPEAGYAHSTFRASASASSISASTTLSAHGAYAGFGYNFSETPFAGACHVSARTGVYATYAGFRGSLDETPYSGEVFYLQVPVYIRFNAPVGNALVEAAAGPSFNYGFAGKIGADGYSDDFFGDDGLKPFDISLDLQATLRLIEPLALRFGYSIGLTNLTGTNLTGESEVSFKRNVFTAGLVLILR